MSNIHRHTECLAYRLLEHTHRIVIWIYEYMNIFQYIYSYREMKKRAFRMPIVLEPCIIYVGWLRLVRLLQIIEVSFAEYRLFNRALLQKRRIIFRMPIVLESCIIHMGWLRLVRLLQIIGLFCRISSP